MLPMITPKGEEREVQTLGNVSLDGSPLDYIVVLSSVVTALAFIPFSITLGSGGSFPLSQGIFPLLGWLLGPIAGAMSCGIGTLIGAFVAPHTAGLPPLSILAAMVGGFAAGSMGSGKGRKYWWFGLTIVFGIAYFLYTSHAIWHNKVSVPVVIAGSFIDWSGMLLFALPTRSLMVRWINSDNIRLVTVGLFLGTWTIAGVSHLCAATIAYYMYNWPEEVWITLIPIIPAENIVRSLVGAVIGSRVIAGLRAIGLVKPKQAIY
jgi:hypothetical protein